MGYRLTNDAVFLIACDDDDVVVVFVIICGHTAIAMDTHVKKMALDAQLT